MSVKALRTPAVAIALAPSAPRFRGQLPTGQVGVYAVWERMTDGSAIVRNFDDEFLAVQCAISLSTFVETHETE